MPFRKGHKKFGGISKGYKYPQTLEKERVLEAMQRHIMSQAEAMTAAQMEHAKGVHYMLLRRPDGTFARATDEKQINAAIAAGSQTFELFTQAPNTSAYAELLNRVFGKATERTELNISGSLDIVGTLARRHKPRA